MYVPTPHSHQDYHTLPCPRIHWPYLVLSHSRAAEAGYQFVVGLLLDKAADVEAFEEDGTTALHLAAQNGHLEVLKMLLDKANIHAAKRGGATSLLLAAESGYVAVVTTLVHAQADIDAANDSGATPLMRAAAAGHVETLKFLLENGANLHHEDVSGATALVHAAASGRAEVVRALILDGAELDAVTNSGGTALMAACESNHQAAARALILAGAALDMLMKGGSSALMLSCLNSHEAISQMLLHEGAKVHGASLTGDGLDALSSEQRDLLESLIKLSFPGCKSVHAEVLRKGTPGGLLLQTQSFDDHDRPQPPTVMRLDDESRLREEISSLSETLQNLGASGATVLRGPIYLDGYGAVVLQLSGACWLLRRFARSGVATLGDKIRSHLRSSTASAETTAEMLEETAGVFAQLWGVGGGLRSLALATAQRVESPSPHQGIELLGNEGLFLNQLASAAAHVLLPARDNARWDKCAERLDSSLLAEVSRLEASRRLVWAQRAAADAVYAASPLKLAPEDELDVMRASSESLTRCLRLLSDLADMQPDDAHWLKGWKPIRATVHGALVAESLIVDECGNSWVLDLANFSRSASLFDDAAQLVTDIFFEQYQLSDDAALRDGCAAFDALVPLADTQLWDSLARLPPPGLSSSATVALAACSSILLHACRLVHAVGALNSVGADRRDLHTTSFLCPLLLHTLRSLLRHKGQPLQQRLIWHAAMRCAAGIAESLLHPPVEPPNLSNEVARNPLQLVEQLILLRGSTTGGNRLVLVTPTQQGSPKHMIVTSLDEEHSASIVIDDIHIRCCLYLMYPFAHSCTPTSGVIYHCYRRRARATPPTLEKRNEAVRQFRKTRAVVQRLQAAHDALVRMGGEVDELMVSITRDEAAASVRRYILDRAKPEPAALAALLEKRLDSLIAERLKWLDRVTEALERHGCSVKDVPQLTLRMVAALQVRPSAALDTEAKAQIRALAPSDEVNDKSMPPNFVPSVVAGIDLSLLVSVVHVWFRERSGITENSGAGAPPRYSAGSQLWIHQDGAPPDSWQAATVKVSANAAASLKHAVDGLESNEVLLHYFNHCPLEMELAAMQRALKTYSLSMCVAHGFIIDALSGRRLDVFRRARSLIRSPHHVELMHIVCPDAASIHLHASECVPIQIQTSPPKPGSPQKRLNHTMVQDVMGLARHLRWMMAERLARGGELSFSPALLVVAGPASGKTSLMSQLVMHTLTKRLDDDVGNVDYDASPMQIMELVPVLIKMTQLARLLESENPAHKDAFANALNFADAFLRITMGGLLCSPISLSSTP